MGRFPLRQLLLLLLVSSAQEVGESSLGVHVLGLVRVDAPARVEVLTDVLYTGRVLLVVKVEEH